MNWKEYEQEVFETLRMYYPSATIQRDIKKTGIYSKRKRQIDIYLEENVGGNVVKIFVECKYYNKVIDIKTVESFIGMADDLDADIGLMVTEKGYSKTALKRAHYNPSHIELDILNLAELKKFQGHIAFPYAGENAALILAPFGWVIDATKSREFICCLYQRGLTFEEAFMQGEVAYINYWDRKKANETLDNLLEIQEKNIRENAQTRNFKIIEFKYLDCIQRNDAKTKLRFVHIEEYPGVELTGFIEFSDFIFFCVWFCDPIKLKRNIRKLERILKFTLPLKIKESKK